MADALHNRTGLSSFCSAILHIPTGGNPSIEVNEQDVVRVKKGTEPHCGKKNKGSIIVASPQASALEVLQLWFCQESVAYFGTDYIVYVLVIPVG